MPYRQNVCAVIADAGRRRVLVFRRADAVMGPHRWQFPQGGVQPGETPEAALHRELREEIGTDRVEVLARAPHPVRYEYPPEVRQAVARQDPEKGRYHGQEQHWFLVRLVEGEEAIRFPEAGAELDAWEWVRPAEALARVVPFKAGAYRHGLQALGLLPP